MTGPCCGQVTTADAPPGGKLTWLRALGSRRAAAITAILGFFTGFLITDGYTAYQQMLPELAGIQQCAAHVVRLGRTTFYERARRKLRLTDSAEVPISPY